MGNDGTLYIVDTENDAVKKLPPGGALSEIGSGFNMPRGIDVTDAGEVIVAGGSAKLLQSTTVAAMLSSLSALKAASHSAFAARQPFLENLDAWAKRPDVVFWDCYLNESNPQLYAYYLNRTYESLADINRTVVTEGEPVAVPRNT